MVPGRKATPRIRGPDLCDRGLKLFCFDRSPPDLCSSRARGGTPGTLGDHRDNLGSGGRGMQGGGVAGGSVLRNLTTPTCRVGKKADVFCHALLWYVLFCHVLPCSALSCHVVFSFSSRARGRDTQGYSGTLGDSRDNLGSGGRGMHGGVGRGVCS